MAFVFQFLLELDEYDFWIRAYAEWRSPCSNTACRVNHEVPEFLQTVGEWTKYPFRAVSRRENLATVCVSRKLKRNPRFFRDI